METILTLDVTQIEPRFKHPQIFEKFDSLSPSEAFIILNDHDPKPLYFQLIAKRGKVFTWEYLQNGPKYWKVKIGKVDASQPQETICILKGIDIEKVKSELTDVKNFEEGSSLAFDEWDLTFLTDYIINTHHSYVKENIPFISEMANKVAREHSGRHPELIKVAGVFNKMANDFSLHLMKEENILFPFIKQLAEAVMQNVKISPASFGTVNNPTRLMEIEHEQAGVDMGAIREITNNYELPADACTSFAILYKKLQEFENDLFVHVHLENNILFPKALKLEQVLELS